MPTENHSAPVSQATNEMPEWQTAELLQRYKRFMADVRLADGSLLTVHCPNTGSMKNCLLPGRPCWYSTSTNAKRKYPHTLEVVTTPGGHLAGVNTGRANLLVERALGLGAIAELQGYRSLQRELRYGLEKSRIDFLLSDSLTDARPCYLEVKSVTLMEAEGQGFFPDSVSDRGTKHLRELMAIAQQGYRAVLLFCVQHTGIEWVKPAGHIDALYAKTLGEALSAGVEVFAYRAEIQVAESLITLNKKIPFYLA